MQQQIEHREFGLIDVRADSAQAGTFSGYGAIFGNVDSYGDIIEKGAFANSLVEWRSKGKLPKMLLQHGGWGIGSEDMLPIGQWTSMSEDTKGLKVEGRLLAMNTERGQLVYEGLKSGELDSLSIGFQTLEMKEEIREGESYRILTEINLWEVSIVTFPANDRAKISSVKSLSLDQLRELEGVLRDGGLSRSDCRAAVSVFKHWLQRDAGAPISTLRDEGVPGQAEANAAAEALVAKFATAGLRF